ncbi:MAG: prepilin-type N-terminal cleavage/methylation domain-containing protein [Firmicutes bacterium]|nr:prepilin-type N-terminal cleavage/methylation domain-containing protein [Bacillota bacterium]
MKTNKKGFTLIELLAVIVVLSIILVITVPMILNTLGSTRQDALQASADSSARFYKDQISLSLLGKKQSGFLIDLKYTNGDLNPQPARCISKEEADILGLNSKDYAINTSCTGTTNLPFSCYTNTSNYSTVTWDQEGNTTVTLIGNTEGGKFVAGNQVLAATSNSKTSEVVSKESSQKLVLTETNSNDIIPILKLHGKDGDIIGTSNSSGSYDINIMVKGKNLFNADALSYFDKQEDGSYLSNTKITTSHHLMENLKGVYTISAKIKSEVGKNYRIMVKYTDGKTTDSWKASTGEYLSYKFTTNGKDIDYIYWGYGASSTNLQFKDLQIEEGTTATSYEPYQEPRTYTITVSEPLRSNNEAYDYIDFEQRQIVRWIDSNGNTLNTPIMENVISWPSDIKTLNGTTIVSTNDGKAYFEIKN